MKIAPDCTLHCQYAVDLGMTEHECRPTCQYVRYEIKRVNPPKGMSVSMQAVINAVEVMNTKEKPE